MASIYDEGKLLMKIDESACNPNEYPFAVPKVFLNGCVNMNFHWGISNWNEDSVVSIKGKKVIEYSKTDYFKVCTTDKAGNKIWVDGRTASRKAYPELDDSSDFCKAEEYTITEYNLETLEKKKYKVSLDNTLKLDMRDYNHLRKFVDADSLSSCCESIFGEKVVQEQDIEKMLAKINGWISF